MITVGIPVYNSIEFISETLNSVEKNLDYISTVIISDNASTDGTSEICREFKRKHPKKVRYIRQKENKGMIYNFAFVLKKAETEYFMHLGSHDILSDNFAKNITEEIHNNEDAVMFYCDILKINEVSERSSKTKEILSYQHLKFDVDDAFDRVMRYITQPTSKKIWFLSYAVYKTDVIRYAYKDLHKNTPIGGDHVIVAKTLSVGRAIYVKDAYYSFRNMPHDDFNRANALKRYKNIMGKNKKIIVTNYGKTIYKEFIKIIIPISCGRNEKWREQVYNACKRMFLMCDTDIEWFIRVYILKQ